MNIKELSTKGFVSNLLIVYLLISLSIVGIITDKVIKTNQTLINIIDYEEYFRFESISIFHLRKYLDGLKEYDESILKYENELEEYNKLKDEYEQSGEELPEEINEPLEPLEYPPIDNIYLDNSPIYFNLMDDYCEIYYLDVELDVEINDYKVFGYKIS